MRTAPEPIHLECSRFSSVLSLIGDKWTVMIVMTLTERPRRFKTIRRTIGGISQQMLARTLRALERDGMVARTVHPTVPPQVEYALTDLGCAGRSDSPAGILGPRPHRGDRRQTVGVR